MPLLDHALSPGLETWLLLPRAQRLLPPTPAPLLERCRRPVARLPALARLPLQLLRALALRLVLLAQVPAPVLQARVPLRLLLGLLVLLSPF